MAESVKENNLEITHTQNGSAQSLNLMRRLLKRSGGNNEQNSKCWSSERKDK